MTPEELKQTHEKRTETHACDLINRQDALEALNSINGTAETDQAFHVIEALPSVQHEQQWIPCSERLPEEYQAVLATLNNGELTYAWRFDVDEWVICEGDRNATTDDILAWMPMPEPYKGEQNGKA